ncbi:MAG: hypothetical protein L6R40_002082 [Gallowayella cf. fulva]|nr:MAG: hypothetical protein L6R40_002082 [Xanthomendoza cf. fulva]
MPLFSRSRPPTASSNSVSTEETSPLTHDTDAMQRFTATGRPMPDYQTSALGNMSGDFSSQAAQHLPQKFDDDSIITVPIPLLTLYPPSNPIDLIPKTTSKERRVSLFGSSKRAKNQEFKMIQMSRKEYLMYWAKDEKGRYIGTEPEGEGRKVLKMRGAI